jgi:periplasmic divalent cation tolerance protein
MLIAVGGTNSRFAEADRRHTARLVVTEFIQVLTTTDTRPRAEEIARALVERRLAACVQMIGPVTSTFRWQGQIDTAEEWLCLAKTRSELYAEVEAAIRAVHTYEVPEILAVPVIAGHGPYLNWMRSELQGSRSP